MASTTRVIRSLPLSRITTSTVNHSQSALRCSFGSSRNLYNSRPRCSNYSTKPHQLPVPWRRKFNDLKPPSAQSRLFSTTPIASHGHLDVPKPGEERTITFIDKASQPHAFRVADGANLLDIAQAYDIDVEGACGGSCACSTCHVIVEDKSSTTGAMGMYGKIPEPTDDENDMLDLAFGLTETSRLGCQVEMSKELDGLVVRLPSMTRNLQKSDFEAGGSG